MRLKHLEISNFRSFETLSSSFSPVLNFFIGDNARGKTTVLEAIHLLCLARSFRTKSDTELCRFGESNYKVSGRFVVQNNIERKVNVSYCKTSGRTVVIGSKPITRYSELIGNFPAVALSSQDHRITVGSPAERRRFADILLCQLSTRYLADLKDYYRILKQRNYILQKVSYRKNILNNEIEPWNLELAIKGSEISKARQSLCNDLTTTLEEVYNKVAESRAKFEIEYLPNVKFSAEDDARDAFQRAIKQLATRERSMGFSLVGPHRDDYLFLIDKKELRRFGSRGEHKTALISLKAAEAQILYNRRGEKPIILLDDLFAELDDKRSKNVLNVFNNGYQLIITSTILEKKSLDIFITQLPDIKVFEFDDKGIISENG